MPSGYGWRGDRPTRPAGSNSNSQHSGRYASECARLAGTRRHNYPVDSRLHRVKKKPCKGILNKIQKLVKPPPHTLPPPENSKSERLTAQRSPPLIGQETGQCDRSSSGNVNSVPAEFLAPFFLFCAELIVCYKKKTGHGYKNGYISVNNIDRHKIYTSLEL